MLHRETPPAGGEAITQLSEPTPRVRSRGAGSSAELSAEALRIVGEAIAALVFPRR